MEYKEEEVIVAEKFVKMSKLFNYNKESKYDYYVLNNYNWRTYTIKKNIKTTSYARNYLGDYKKTYTDEEISYVLTELMQDILTQANNIFRPVNGNYKEVHNYASKINWANYNVEYYTLNDDHRICVKLRDKRNGNLVAQFSMSWWRETKLRNGDTLNYRMGSYKNSKTTPFEIISLLMITLIGRKADNPSRRF